MKLKQLLFILILSFCSLIVVACGHKHNYNIELAESKYLALKANEQHVALYYKSCSCGQHGNEMFFEGDHFNHVYSNYVSNMDATFESDGTKTAICDFLNCNHKHTVVDDGTRTNELFDYTITYTSKFKNNELDSTTITSSSRELISFSAPIIVGYKFTGWSDGKTSNDRTDNFELDNSTLIANYEREVFNMPIVTINTENSQEIVSKDVYLNCEISITNTLEEYQLDNVGAEIKGRGNSTWTFEKKPYRIKFDSKQSLFGSSYKQKSWTLLANYADKSLARNSIAYELGQRFDHIEFTSMHQFVELYLNNQYLGVYILCDQIQTGDGRVDVDEELYDDGDTGYLIEMDGRAPEEGIINQDYFEVLGVNYALKTPDTDDENYDPEIYIPYIKTYFENCFDSIINKSWDDVKELIDVDSFVDNYIIQELFANPDCNFSSFYLYKDRGGKLFCGPLWDFDIAGGNNNEAMENIEKEWPADSSLYATSNIWFKHLFERQEFKDLIKERLKTYEEDIKTTIELLNPTNPNGYYLLYQNSFERNFEKWNILNKYIWNDTKIIGEIQSVSGQMLYLRDWLTTRYYYLLVEFNK